MRILVVEDERKIASFIERGLRAEGHKVELVRDLDHARRLTTAREFDLLLVDRMLPDGDGLTLVRELRRRKVPTPIVCVTARDRVEERVEGLHGGADDYIVKPFAFDELLARIAAVTRRTPTADRIEVADLSIDVPARRVFRAGKEVRLTAQEFDLLRYLASHEGEVLSRTRILDAVWGTTLDPRTNVVDVYVSYLRAKLDKGGRRSLIHTVRGAGYVLEAAPR